MRSSMSLPLILVVVVIIRSLPVPGSQFQNEALAITFQPYYLHTVTWKHIHNSIYTYYRPGKWWVQHVN
jgi:hypothetical protein